MKFAVGVHFKEISADVWVRGALKLVLTHPYRIYEFGNWSKGRAEQNAKARKRVSIFNFVCTCHQFRLSERGDNNHLCPLWCSLFNYVLDYQIRGQRGCLRCCCSGREKILQASCMYPRSNIWKSGSWFKWLFVSLTFAVTALRSNKRWQLYWWPTTLQQPWRGNTRLSLLHRTTTLAARCACLHFRHRPRPCGSLWLSAFLRDTATWWPLSPTSPWGGWVT